MSPSPVPPSGAPMRDTKDFPLGDVLSVVTEMLVSPSGVGAVYELLGYMTGESLYTHQLPRANRECAPALLTQHPQLAGLDVSGVNAATWRAWLTEQEARFGATLAVRPLASRAARYDTPVADLIEMVGDPTKVLVIDIDPTEAADHA